jgi:ABC-type transporter Mla subunit MlaD
MRAATEEVSKILSSFGGQFEQMLSQMAKAGDGIKRQEGDTVGQLQTMLAYLGTVAEKLEAARMLSGNVSQQTIERLDEVVNAVQAHMNTLASGAQTASGVMRGIGQIYSDQTQLLTKGVNEAHDQVLVMNKDIDAMQERTDRMRAALKVQGDDLMSSLRQILTQLEMTGDGLTEAVNRTLEQQVEAGMQKIG